MVARTYAELKRRLPDVAQALGWAAPNAGTLGLLRRLGVLLLGGAGLWLCLSVYESLMLGRPPLGEMAPFFGAYDMLRSAGVLAFCGVAAALVWRGRQSGGDLAMPAAGAAAGLVLTAAAFAAILLLAASPRAFAQVCAEDGAVETLSAAALFAGCLVLLRVAAARGGGLKRTIALGLAVLLFLTAMEEISWMQRVVGFETPEPLAAVNMQSEFNLHNLHTDYFENLYYLGSFALLVLLPLLAFAMPWLRSLRGLSEFVPGPWVAAAAAPAAMLNYGMWNVVPMQASMMLTVAAMALFALAARRRGAKGEAGVFGAIAVAIVVGQGLLLAQGHRMEQIFDASEYKELFIALGLACFAVDVRMRASRSGERRRYRP